MTSMITSLFAILLSMTLLFFLIFSRASRKRRVSNRIENLASVASDDTEKQKENTKTSKRFIVLLSNKLAGMQFSEKTIKRLEQAGSDLKLEEYLVIRVLFAIGVSLVLYMFGVLPLLSILASPIGYMAPDIYMKRKAKKRQYLLSFQLVEALGTMSNSLRAGFSFTQTVQLIGKEMPDPIGPEFNRVIRELGLGIPLNKVFQSMLERLPNKELEVVFQAILAQRQTGGNLAELMETMEETIRGRIKILGELKTLTAQGKISGLIITLLPIALGFFLYFSSQDYFGPMLSHPLGWIMLSVSGAGILIGWLIIQKIVKIEV